MLPQYSDDLLSDFRITTYPSRTYRLNEDTMTIGGYVDGEDAIKQAILLILNTERYKYEIYSWNYGVELVELIGMSSPLLFVRLQERISEALIQDDRIESVDNFEFRKEKDKVFVAFTVSTYLGEIQIESEVDINVNV